jgi:hypothetical protein
MPKNKSKVHSAKAAAVGDDNDFDRMLAEVTAADSQLPADVPASTATTANIASSSSSSSSSSGGGGQGTSLPGLQVSEMAIIGACRRGDITQLRRWGQQGVRVKSADMFIDSILFGVSPDILRCLVKELGADVNGARLSDGATPLYVAAQTGNLALAQCLVEELGADVNQEAGYDGGTPLFIAAQKGHLAVLRCMIKKFGANVDVARRDGFTPLYVAAQNGHLAVVRYLVKELGADVNKAREDGATPLIMVAQYG